MAIVKANYVRRGKEAKARAKATIRYILSLPRRNGRVAKFDLSQPGGDG